MRKVCSPTEKSTSVVWLIKKKKAIFFSSSEFKSNLMQLFGLFETMIQLSTRLNIVCSQEKNWWDFSKNISFSKATGYNLVRSSTIPPPFNLSTDCDFIKLYF